MTKENRCLLCESTDLTLIREKLRYDVPCRVFECQTCGLNFLEQRVGNLKTYYETEYRKVYTPKPGTPQTSEEIFEACLPFQRRRVELLKPFLFPQAKLLDIGCSAGHFLHSVRPHVGECLGLELNQSDVNFIRHELGMSVIDIPLEEADIPEGSLDIITMFHVLEHIENPLSFLRRARQLLKPNGKICVEVPNINDVLISKYQVKPFIDFWFREVHLFNFSALTLQKMAQKAGFRGEVLSITDYNLINHLSWILTGKPQPDMQTGMSQPELVKDSTDSAAGELNQWIGLINDEYKKILNKHYLGDSITFIGNASSGT